MTNPGGGTGPSNGGGTSAEPAVWMVSSVVAGFEPGVTEAGLNVQVLPAGSPVQEKTIATVFAPPTGATVIVEVPEWPCVIVKVLGFAATVKFSLTVWVNAAEVLLANVNSPSYLAVT